MHNGNAFRVMFYSFPLFISITHILVYGDIFNRKALDFFLYFVAICVLVLSCLANQLFLYILFSYNLATEILIQHMMRLIHR